MDYIPRRRDAAGFHLNWWSHSYMARVLEQLGADLTEWSGSNDGAYITARTCRKWSSTMRAGLAAGAIRQVVLPERGSRPGVDMAIPVVTGVAVEVDSLTYMLNVLDIGPELASIPSDTPTFELDASAAALIVKFADFLDQCRGCWQW